jgi:N-acetylmuramoyl-L-alanine amidase
MNLLSLNHSVKFLDCFEQVNIPRKIKFIVIHHIQANSLQHALDQLYDHKVSAHFIIDEDGNVFELVNEKDIAYHAGVSYWQGYESLNKYSIGIELISKDPFHLGFTNYQMNSCVELTRYLLRKYEILARNVVGHSDIAYDKITNLLDRKQDPSHLFDWSILADYGVAILPKITLSKNDDNIIFYPGDSSADIFKIKNRLKNFGYRVSNINNTYDEEMQILARVFNRRFNPQKYQENSDLWYHSSQNILTKISS